MRTRTVEQYLPEVRKIATRMASRLQIEASDAAEELYALGCMALAESYKRYADLDDFHALNAVKTRVKGAMIDYVKGKDYRVARHLLPYPGKEGVEGFTCECKDNRSIETKILQKQVSQIVLELVTHMKDSEQALVGAAVTGTKLVKAAPALTASQRTKIKNKVFSKLREKLCTIATKAELLY